ncbi:MAG: diguanylate cyclase [Magnetococcales bacterium]|nr:diguanylate cyclase [Magnetococcales bacterium]
MSATANTFKPKLFLLILVMPGILWFAVLAAGMQGLLSIRDNQAVAHQDRELLKLGTQAIDHIREAQFHFKSQVQHWKNMLLRGQDVTQRNLHLQRMEQEEQQVQEVLQQLPSLLQPLGLDPNILQQVASLQQQHRALGLHYRSALRVYNDSLQKQSAAHTAAMAADKVVFGQDTLTSDNTDQLAVAIVQQVQQLVMNAAERDDRWFSRQITYAAWILAAFILLILPVAFFTVRRHVIQPITLMTDAIEQVAQGNLQQQVAAQSMDELSRMGLAFNHMASELNRIHSGLQSERDKLTTIIVAAQEGIVITDRLGNIALINPAAERLLEKSAEQITREGFLNLLDDPDYLHAYLNQSGIEIPSTVVYHNRVLSFYAATIHDPDGQAIGSAALMRDITEEKRLEKQLRDLSNTDSLTSLNNRRRMEEILSEEFSRAKRYKLPLSILMLDVDHFKRFNDQHGHDQGDRVLQAVARVMHNTCRDVDSPCRYGGEEFCLILPSTALEGADRMAERLRYNVEQHRVDGLQVTISIGVAVFPLVGETAESLKKLADEALYQAKHAGRNCYRIAGQPLT